MKLSSLIFLAGWLSSTFAVLMKTTGSKDPIDDRFFAGLIWVSVICFTIYVVVKVVRWVKATRRINQWRHRLDQADDYKHSGVR